MDKASYTAASVMPAKLFCDVELIRRVKERRIHPVHLQVNPTNRCPLNCSFCSCANRDKDAELSIDDLKAITKDCIDLGTKAVTITGGGDPLAYRNIGDYVVWLKEMGAESALVTNGVLFKDMVATGLGDWLNCLTWCRISVSDNRAFNQIEVLPAMKYKTDWSFSYVVTGSHNPMNLVSVVAFANKYNFTHVRVVDDIIGDSGVDFSSAKHLLKLSGVDGSKVIWQGRKDYRQGNPRCLISLLKPNLTPYGFFTGCCGSQFSSDPPMLDWTRNYSMGSDIKQIIEDQRFYNGANCRRCYYGDYNDALCAIQDSDKLHHKNFI